MSTTSDSSPRARANANSRSLSFSKPSINTKARLSLSSEKSSLNLRPIVEKHRTFEDYGNRNKQQVFRFVYSEAVKRALRRTYRVPDFGPLSAYNPEEAGVEIGKLPELYDDFVYLKNITQHNKKYIAKLRQELGDRYEEYERVETQPKSKSQKAALRNAIALAKFRQNSRAGSVAKLPPIVPVSPVQEREAERAESRSQNRGASRKSSMTRASSILSGDMSIHLAASRPGSIVSASEQGRPLSSTARNSAASSTRSSLQALAPTTG